MEKVSIDKISPSMKSAVALFDSSGKLIVDAGGVIDEEIIDRLRQDGFPGIYICDNSLIDIAFPFVISIESRVQLIQYLKQLEENPNSEAVAQLIKDFIVKLIDHLKGKNEIEVVPPEIRPQSIGGYMSKVNICILALLTAMKLQISDEDMKLMSLKILIPRSFGNNRLVSPKARETINLVKDFDHLVSGQNFIKNLSTYHALNKIKEKLDVKYQRQIADAFFQVVAPYPLGSKVRLSNGAIGVVLDINKTSVYKPIVRIIMDNKRICETEIDLMKHHECTVLDVIN